MSRGVTSGMLVAIIVGIVFILLWTFSGVGIPGLQKLEQNIFGTVDVVKPGDKPVSPGGVLIKEPFRSVKLGSDPASDIFGVAKECFEFGWSSVADKYSACAVVDPSGLSDDLTKGMLYEKAVSLYSAKASDSTDEYAWIIGEPSYDWRLNDDFVSSSSSAFLVCTKVVSVPVSSNAPFSMHRTLTLVTLTRGSC